MSETRNIRLMRALEGDVIRTIEKEALTDRLTTIVGQTYLLLGYQTPEPQTLAILVAKIASDLIESYGFRPSRRSLIASTWARKGCWAISRG